MNSFMEVNFSLPPSAVQVIAYVYPLGGACPDAETLTTTSCTEGVIESTFSILKLAGALRRDDYCAVGLSSASCVLGYIF